MNLRNVLVVVSALLGAYAAPSSSYALECDPSHDEHAVSHNPVWGRNRPACVVIHAQPFVEGWVRGWGAYDDITGTVSVAIELETDHIDKGPCGLVWVELFDDDDQKVGTVGWADENNPFCRGGRLAPHAEASNSEQSATVTRNVGGKVKYFVVYGRRTGAHVAPGDID